MLIHCSLFWISWINTAQVSFSCLASCIYKLLAYEEEWFLAVFDLLIYYQFKWSLGLYATLLIHEPDDSYSKVKFNKFSYYSEDNFIRVSFSISDM
jgi:hypothetical protein